MSRMGFIKRNPKRALSSLAVLMLAVGLVAGSGAFFQSSDANNNSTVSTGNIALQAYGGEDNAGSNGREYDARNCNPREASQPGTTGNYDGCYGSVNNGSEPFASIRNGAIFEISNLEPGQVVEKKMRVKNVGTLDADVFLKLTGATQASPNLFNSLYVRIVNDSNGHTVHSGRLNQLDDSWKSATPAGDTLGEGENDVFTFQVKLPETGTDQSNIMNRSETLQFTWVGRDQGAPNPNTVAP